MLLRNGFGVFAVLTSIYAMSADARASCSPREKCLVSTGTVVSCKANDVGPTTEVGKRIAAIKFNHERTEALRDQYRGVIVELKLQTEANLPCKRGLAKQLYDVAAFLLTSRGGLAPSPQADTGILRYFFPSREAAETVCAKQFAEKRELRVLQAETCCDGDPGAPCLMPRN